LNLTAMPVLSDRTVRLTGTDYKALRRIAEIEQRTLRAVLMRALQAYAPKIVAEMKKKEAT